MRLDSVSTRFFLASFLIPACVGAQAAPQARPSENIPPSLHGDSLGDGGPASSARLVTPVRVSQDRQGNLYIGERGAHRIRRVDARTGIITTFAGTGQEGFNGDGIPAAHATFTQPGPIVFDRDGNMIIGDTFNHRIRRVDMRTGIITTIVGTGQPGFSGDGGPATSARINGPFDISLDSRGNLYFADTENHRIRRVDQRTGVITTVAGDGRWDYAGDGGPATNASFARPHVVLVDGDTALLIGDSFNLRIRRVDLRTGVVQTVAGTGERGSFGEGVPARQASFTYFGDLVFTPDGDLLVTGTADARIRRIDKQTGIITTVAGIGLRGFSGDGGPATQARLHLPISLIVDPAGNFLFTDMWNGRVRRIDARTGVISTIVGTAPSPRTPAVAWDFYYNRDSLQAAVDAPVRLVAPSSSGVRVVSNVVHDSSSRYARLDAYLPTGLSRDARVPVVVFVPGRNDTEVRLKNSGGFRSWGQLIASAGAAAVVLDHSLGTRGYSLGPADSDVRSALAYLRREAPALQIDPDRICLVGFSSGALLLTPFISGGDSWLKCAAAWYPELESRRDDLFFWIKDTRPVRERFALASAVPAARIPMLFVGAGRESAMRAELSALRSAAASNRGVTFLEHPTGGIGFERLLDDAETQAIVRQTLCFLQQNLGVEGSYCR